MSINLETIYRIHSTAGYIEVTKDADGVGNVDLRWFESHNKTYSRPLTVPADSIDDVIEALQKLKERLLAK